MTQAPMDGAAPLAVRPLKRCEYDRLVALGMFEGERLELLGGKIVERSPQGTEPAYALRRLVNLITPVVVGRAQVQAQQPLAASVDSEPEPDLAIVDLGDHLDDHPRTAHLVVEVADSSRNIDLGLKVALYAQMEVPDYWVVDLVRREVVVHRSPSGDRYREIRTLAPGDTVSSLRFPDLSLRVSDVVPAR